MDNVDRLRHLSPPPSSNLDEIKVGTFTIVVNTGHGKSIGWEDERNRNGCIYHPLGATQVHKAKDPHLSKLSLKLLSQMPTNV